MIVPAPVSTPPCKSSAAPAAMPPPANCSVPAVCVKSEKSSVPSAALTIPALLNATPMLVLVLVPALLNVPLAVLPKLPAAPTPAATSESSFALKIPPFTKLAPLLSESVPSLRLADPSLVSVRPSRVLVATALTFSTAVAGTVKVPPPVIVPPVQFNVPPAAIPTFPLPLKVPERLSRGRVTSASKVTSPTAFSTAGALKV